MVFLFLLDALIFLHDLQITDCKPHLVFFLLPGESGCHNHSSVSSLSVVRNGKQEG